MYKEIIICIIIIFSIFTLEYITQDYTDKKTYETVENLENMREDLRIKKDDKKLNEDMDKIYNNWMKLHDSFSYYIEHNELEKLEKDLVALKSEIEIGEYEDAIIDLDKSIFSLKHIQDKYKLNLGNIF